MHRSVLLILLARTAQREGLTLAHVVSSRSSEVRNNRPNRHGTTAKKRNTAISWARSNARENG
jgi:hypothetical protein